MKLRFETWFRGSLLVLLVLVAWSVWAVAQPTSGTKATSTEANPAAGAAAAREELKPWAAFGLERVGLLQHEVLHVPVWQYVASLIYVFLAFYVSRLLDILVRGWLKRWAQRTTSKLDDLLLELIRGPIRVMAFVVLLHLGLRVFAWPEWLEEFLSKGLQIIVALSLTYLVLKLVDLAMGYWKEQTAAGADPTMHQQLFPILRKSVKVFVLIVAVLVTSQNLGLNITGLIASLSIGGLALGLAAQDTLANLFGAVAVLTDKPFRLGDRIQLDSVDGVVESIGFRSTRVRNLDGHLVTIPNKTVGNATITNVTVRPHIRTLINLGITYDTPTEKVKQALGIVEAVYRAHAMTKDVWVSFNKFADSALNLTVIHWWSGTDYKAYLAGMQELNLHLKQRFDEAGISFAFPTQTLYLKQDSEWRWTPGARQ